MEGMLNGNQEFDSPSEALSHYGVKGMKWGVRNEDGPGGGRTAGAQELKRLDKVAAGNSDLILEQAGVAKNPNYERNRKILIAAGVGLGVAALGAGAYYAYSKQGGVVAPPSKDHDPLSTADKFTQQYSGGLKNQLTKKLPPLDTLDDNDVTLPRSTIFRRITGSANEPLSDSHMYVSHLDEDADRYVGVFSKVVKNRTGGDAYLTNIEMNTSVSSPSLKKRVGIMRDMLDEVDRDPQSLTEGMSFREVLIESTAASRAQATNTSSTHHESLLGRLNDDDLVRETYGTFVNGMGGQINNPQYRVSHVSSYLDKVRGMGYNAMVDDANTGVLARSPMLLLTPQSSVKSRTFTRIDDTAIREARNRIRLFKDDEALVRHAQMFTSPQAAFAHIRGKEEI